ncbi:MAG TPA: AraC family transcriptional regulator [Ramlibacter sp.]|nr:AraC family transcriptional regulator [Ramlibacter sp.]
MQALLQAALGYTAVHATSDGLATTPIPGLRMMCVHAPSGPMHSVYRPLVCLILQGAKQMTVAGEVREVQAGGSVVVTADVPVTGRIVRASAAEPYCAVAVEFDLGLLAQLCAEVPAPPVERPGGHLFVREAEAAVLDCAARLVRLLDRPEAVHLLHPGITRELHYWLLCGAHGETLRGMAAPGGYASRIGEAMRVLRAGFRGQLTVEQLAAAARMGVTAFHRHFKATTSLTPLQFQKQLRLVEARRLMRDQGLAASSAAYDVGYQSVPQFTRDYARMFGAPPGRDTREAMRRGDGSPGQASGRLAGRPADDLREVLEHG